MVDGGGVLATHTRPVLVRPELGVLTAGDGDLVPELGAHAGEGLGLGHGQSDLHTFHKNLNIIFQSVFIVSLRIIQ